MRADPQGTGIHRGSPIVVLIASHVPEVSVTGFQVRRQVGMMLGLSETSGDFRLQFVAVQQAETFPDKLLPVITLHVREGVRIRV